MPNKNLTERAEYKALRDHCAGMSTLHMRDLFAKDAQRFEKFSLKISGLFLDYSKHLATEETMALLHRLGQACEIGKARDGYFKGAVVNVSENRPALHMALRGSTAKDLSVNGENVAAFVNAVHEKMKIFCDKIRKDKKFTDIVSIGMGGSELGSRAICEALPQNGPAIHFAANVDGVVLGDLFKKLKPETTFFVIISKNFGTPETLANAERARQWVEKALGKAAVDGHFAAATENVSAAQAFGIPADCIFPMRAWTGGRFSVWSAAGLPVALYAGFDVYKQLLDGARAMDEHFLSAPPEKNMPVIMGLLGVWYRNFFGYSALAVLPYAERLKGFPAYLQQIEMESNGKSVNRDGKILDYPTATLVFGDTGTRVQHAFMQSLHQGVDVIPCDFILSGAPMDADAADQHRQLNANALAQSRALLEGRHEENDPHKDCPGNRPSSTLVMDRLDAKHLGMLMALYEHKVFVQSLLWNINSFDQWGVELGKTIYKDIYQAFDNEEKTKYFESSTRGLLKHLKNFR